LEGPTQERSVPLTSLALGSGPAAAKPLFVKSVRQRFGFRIDKQGLAARAYCPSTSANNVTSHHFFLPISLHEKLDARRMCTNQYQMETQRFVRPARPNLRASLVEPRYHGAAKIGFHGETSGAKC